MTYFPTTDQGRCESPAPGHRERRARPFRDRPGLTPVECAATLTTSAASCQSPASAQHGLPPTPELQGAGTDRDTTSCLHFWVTCPDLLICCQDSGPQGRGSSPSRVEFTEIFFPWRFCTEAIGGAETRLDSQHRDPGSVTACGTSGKSLNIPVPQFPHL